LAEFGEYPYWPVAPDGFGGAVTAGNFSGSVTIKEETRSGFTDRDMFVARFSATGQLMWLKILPSLHVTGLAVAGDGAFLTGTFDVSAKIGETNLVPEGAGNVWLARLALGSDPSAPAGGTPQWIRGYASSSRAVDAKVAANRDAVYMAAEFSENADFGSGTLTSNGASDIAIVRVDP
jgi:hypothetical protein